MPPPPFIIHGLGRSRTAWLSAFLTYGPWKCYHETGLFMRSMDDFRGFFQRPYTGTAETGAVLAWPLIRHVRPDIRTVLIRRNVDEAVEAMAETYRQAGLPFDGVRLRTIFHRSDKALDKISGLPETITLDYAELTTEEGCKRIFEFCLQQDFDREHWLSLRDRHIEADLRAVVSYYWANRDGVEKFKRICKTELIHLVRSGAIEHAIH